MAFYIFFITFYVAIFFYPVCNITVKSLHTIFLPYLLFLFQKYTFAVFNQSDIELLHQETGDEYTYVSV